ncbi:putative D-beta-hydroxybutyrate dehydrogenase, mitochondrial [Penaeus vannamei]|uniref:Putative D-beta-hydroxybutyrate dehydrogenase, mitochondrial n=1 Tax=Penaeus vannamei TaxID=6689 RepID=A0A3R7PAY3_PENVA|nr:putative D-beta-hydroxybutyrate dehydrogenase, mitochondrial [Penaeus vannamei]
MNISIAICGLPSVTVLLHCKMLWTMDKASRLLFWCGLSLLLAGVSETVIPLSFWVTFSGAFLVLGNTYLLLASFKGFHVFAGCLRAGGGGAHQLRSSASPRLQVIQLDITRDEEVNEALREVKSLLSPRGDREKELWGLVSNAGISTFGAVEWTPLRTFREVADVNVFGHIRVIKAFLPLIRKSKGRLVNVSSAEGRFTAPFVAAYELTKHAMEGFSDCLRDYFSGTKLHTAERAGALAGSLWSAMTDEVRAAYGGGSFGRVVSSMQSVTNTGLVDLTTAVDAMVEALTQRFPQARYTCMDSSLYARGLVAQHLPEWIYDFLYITEARNAWYN